MSATVACGGEPGADTTRDDDLSGGRVAPEAALDAVGMLGESYVGAGGKTLVDEFCTGTLIAPQLVLTAKHCFKGALDASGHSFVGGLDASTRYFVVGASASTFKQALLIDHVVAENEIAADSTFVQYGSDVAVAHLVQPVRGVAPVRIGRLAASHQGKTFSILGYGFDETGQKGTRKEASVTLLGVGGKIFERAFGNFDTFLKNVPTLAPTIGDMVDEIGHGADGLQKLRAYYDEKVLLADYEAAIRFKGDAVICRGDSGGPLLGTEGNERVVFGVASWGLRADSDRQCAPNAFGVYAVIGPKTLEFIERELAKAN